MTRILSFVLYLAGSAVLAGCFGGGGGGGNVQPDDALAPQDVQTANTSGSLGAAQRAATSLPRFGSVTQSHARNVAGVTTDAAEVTLDTENERGILTVTREDGSSFTLDSDIHTVGSTSVISPVTGRPAGGAILANVTDTEATIAAVAVEWDIGYGNWLAGGYWLHFMGDIAGGHATSAEMGAFVDGPELGNAEMPSGGTGTYNGLSAGLYVSRYGTDPGLPLPAGTVEIGDYVGDIELTANFDTSRISGTVDNISVTGAAETPSGEQFSHVDVPTDYVLHLDALGINDDGAFRGEGVTLTHPHIDIIRSDGAWGGQFSNIDDSMGNPRLVAGTAGGTGETAGGSEAAFVGAFYGVTDQFE